MSSILFVANVCKEHILKFHIPTISYFKEKGWRVDVACSGNENVPNCDNQFKTSWKRNPFTFKTIKGIRELKQILKNNHYDIVYCHTPVGGLVGRLASKEARKKGTKVVYCAHGFHFYKGASFVNWILFYPIEKWLSKKTDSIFLVNDEDYEFALKKLNKCKNIELVPEVGVNVSKFEINDRLSVRNEYRNKLNISNDTFVLTYVAELIKNKNQTMLVDCLELLKKQNDNVKLILVGPDHFDNKIQEYALSKGVQNDVICLGWRSDVAELLSMADVCVASSIREGFGINIVEALYCGLPVVATNNRGHKTIINNGINGYLVELNDAAEMKNKVELIMNHQDTLQIPLKSELKKYDCVEVAKILFDKLSSCVAKNEI